MTNFEPSRKFGLTVSIKKLIVYIIKTIGIPEKNNVRGVTTPLKLGKAQKLGGAEH